MEYLLDISSNMSRPLSNWHCVRQLSGLQKNMIWGEAANIVDDRSSFLPPKKKEKDQKNFANSLVTKGGHLRFFQNEDNY